MALTTDMTVVTQKIVDTLDSAKTELGLADVYYGDQKLIPRFPAACVESFPKSRDFRETRKFEVVLRTGIMVYHGKLDTAEAMKKAAEVLAEAVEGELHSDHTLGGLVVFGYVSRIDPGVALRGQTMIRATRLTWEGLSQERF